MPPTSVVSNGVSVPYARFGGPNTWSYDGVQVWAVIELAGVSTGTPLDVTVVTLPTDDSAMSGVKGGIGHGILAKQALDYYGLTPGTKVRRGMTSSQQVVMSSRPRSPREGVWMSLRRRVWRCLTCPAPIRQPLRPALRHSRRRSA